MIAASDSDWLQARVQLLEKEKALTKLRDEVSEARRKMPWRRISEPYCFSDNSGRYSLNDLFTDKTQLVVYHYMFGPGWSVGCKSCSFWADQYDAMEVHLAARDVALAVVSRAPWQDFADFKNRMGWKFRWLSSSDSRFNEDFNVSFPGQSQGVYNYVETKVQEELPGLSVFAKDDDGNVYHTYSAYARGLDSLNATYQVLDLVPKGRDEDNLPYGMAWLEFHDQYGN